VAFVTKCRFVTDPGNWVVWSISFSGGDGDDEFHNTTPDIPSVAYGGDGDDILTGGGCDDRLYGQGGADVLRGNGGPDSLYGGAGVDDLHGGLGNALSPDPVALGRRQKPGNDGNDETMGTMKLMNRWT
jgi:Ca2+-binding RTX toxin-like protein